MVRVCAIADLWYGFALRRTHGKGLRYGRLMGMVCAGAVADSWKGLRLGRFMEKVCAVGM